MKLSASLAFAGLVLAGCADKAAAPSSTSQPASAPTKKAEAPLRDNPDVPPPPPVARDREASKPVVPPKVYEGKTQGASSPEALAEAFVAAAKKRDEAAFIQLAISGRDVALHFEPTIQANLRVVAGRLPRKFATYIQQIPVDAELISFKLGFAVDFQRGQGATTPMPGRLGSELTIKAGTLSRTLPVGRIAKIEGRWKIVDF